MTVAQAKLLAFAAWQESRGQSSRDPAGESWAKFDEWWTATTGTPMARELTIHQLCLLAWGAAQMPRFEAWWSSLPP